MWDILYIQAGHDMAVMALVLSSIFMGYVVGLQKTHKCGKVTLRRKRK